MLEKLKKDNFLFGFAMGLLVPVFVFIIVYFIDDYLSDMQKVRTVIKDSTKFLLGVFFNLILFRIYMVNWRFDRTGKGILAMTFLLAILYVVLFEVMGEKYLF